MKDNKILDFGDVFPFYHQYNVKRAMKLNLVRDCTNKILSESDFIHADLRIRVLVIIDDISLMVIKKMLKVLINEEVFLKLLFYNCCAQKNYMKKKQMKKLRKSVTKLNHLRGRNCFNLHIWECFLSKRC